MPPDSEGFESQFCLQEYPHFLGIKAEVLHVCHLQIHLYVTASLTKFPEYYHV